MKKAMVWILAAVMGLAILGGCGKEKETPAPEPEKIQEEPAADPHQAQARSYFTGEWIDEDLAKVRPFAVMLGNTTQALPQYGIKDADVIIEAPVEGALTRLMAVYQNYENAEKIMSVRSCRHYYVDWALEFDAIYAHYGQAKYAKEILSKDYVDNLNGMEAAVSNLMYPRDPSRKAPHNSYTTGEKIREAIALKGYDTQISDDYKGHYRFNEDDEKQIELSGENAVDAVVVEPGYRTNAPWFVYDERDGLYYRYQYGGEQTDGIDNSQLSCKNILLQVCDWSVIDSRYGYLDVDTMSGGAGYYITNGKAVPVTWEKESESAPTRYYGEDGTEITLNQGKTWVCVVQDTYQDKIAFYGSLEEFDSADK